MYAVIFEVQPKTEFKAQDYFDLAAELRPELEAIDGFMRWREHYQHRQAQQKGRGEIFKDYRIRVAKVIRDYGMTNRKEAP